MRVKLRTDLTDTGHIVLLVDSRMGSVAVCSADSGEVTGMVRTVRMVRHTVGMMAVVGITAADGTLASGCEIGEISTVRAPRTTQTGAIGTAGTDTYLVAVCSADASVTAERTGRGVRTTLLGTTDLTAVLGTGAAVGTHLGRERGTAMGTEVVVGRVWEVAVIPVTVVAVVRTVAVTVGVGGISRGRGAIEITVITMVAGRVEVVTTLILAGHRTVGVADVRGRWDVCSDVSGIMSTMTRVRRTLTTCTTRIDAVGSVTSGIHGGPGSSARTSIMQGSR